MDRSLSCGEVTEETRDPTEEFVFFLFGGKQNYDKAHSSEDPEEKELFDQIDGKVLQLHTLRVNPSDPNSLQTWIEIIQEIIDIVNQLKPQEPVQELAAAQPEPKFTESLNNFKNSKIKVHYNMANTRWHYYAPLLIIWKTF
uniref:PH domain-containing protein n=1 Tax=Ditylenchus dipsaci TaxID=166011 RepID=A0A915DCP1_9BILA